MGSEMCIRDRLINITNYTFLENRDIDRYYFKNIYETDELYNNNRWVTEIFKVSIKTTV